jgi:hypothetical protein
MGSKWTLGRLAGRGVEWFHLAQDRDRWQAVVNAVMNLWILALGGGEWSVSHFGCA